MTAAAAAAKPEALLFAKKKVQCDGVVEGGLEGQRFRVCYIDVCRRRREEVVRSALCVTLGFPMNCVELFRCGNVGNRLLFLL